jgi:hypothetical protein
LNDPIKIFSVNKINQKFFQFFIWYFY